jgi:hypothetical protein
MTKLWSRNSAEDRETMNQTPKRLHKFERVSLLTLSQHKQLECQRKDFSEENAVEIMDSF